MSWHRSHCCHARHCEARATAEGAVLLVPVMVVVGIVGVIVQVVRSLVGATVTVGGSMFASVAPFAPAFGMVVLAVTAGVGVVWFLRRWHRRRGQGGLGAMVRTFAAAPSESDVARIVAAGDALEPLPSDVLLELEAVYRHQVAAVVADRVVRGDERARLDLLRRVCRLSHADAARAETEAFLQVYAAAIADGTVTREEELQLDELRYGLTVSDTAIQDELANLWRLCAGGASLRPELQAAQQVLQYTLVPIEAPAGLRLQPEEVCLFTSAFTEKQDRRGGGEPGRLAAEQLVDVGSGTLYVTNRRLIMTGADRQAIARDELLDVKVDPETRILALIVEGQRSPVYLAVAEPFVLAAYLDRMRDLAAARPLMAMV